MAEIPVEHKKGGLPWWLPLLLLLLLIPFLFFLVRGCNDRSAGLGNTNANGNTRSAVTNGMAPATTNANTSTAVVFNEAERIREANERARLALEKVSPNGTPQQVFDALNLSIVNFAKDSAEIPESDKPLLKLAADMLKKAPATTRVEVDGYTDNDGDAAHNQTLSERRAAAVRDEFVRLGAPTGIFTTKGYGETQPKATNETPEGRFQNRRIEYKLATGGAAEKITGNNGNTAQGNAAR